MIAIVTMESERISRGVDPIPAALDEQVNAGAKA
jgi:hypothetical protein